MNSLTPLDYGTVVATDTVRIERLLPGPIDRVWAYLTDADLRARWLAGGDMDLRPGGAVELRFDHGRLSRGDDPPPAKYSHCTQEIREYGRITAIDPPHRLAYTWNEAGDESSEVEFQLSERGEQVQLIVTHRRLADRNAMVSVASGWHAHLDVLLAQLSDQEPGGFWRNHTRLEAEYERRIPAG